MKIRQSDKPQTIKEQNERIQDASNANNPLKSKSKWSAVQRVRLPHKVGLPLGSGGGGDSIER